MKFGKKSALLIGIVLILSVFSGCSKKESVETVANVDEKKIKAGFVYVGPIGDYGFSKAHDEGRLYVEEKFPWLETVYVESVPESDSLRIVDRLIQEEDCDIVFTCSFGFMDDTIKAGEKYPDKTFMHCAGFKQSENVGSYFADLYQMLYLNGLMAGALTKSDKVGYVGAFPIPELYRHIGAFSLGVKEANPDAEINVKWIYEWYGPDKAREAAEALIAEGCDTLAFTEDTPAVIEVAQTHTEKGNQIYSFSHYNPMQEFGPDTVVSGHLTNWNIMYEKILQDLYDETWTSEDMWWLAAEKAVVLGGNFEEKFNPKFVDELKAAKINSKEFGEISAYDLVLKRLQQMEKSPVEFDPYTGPIYDNEGNLVLEDGEVATKEQLLSMMYFVDNVTSKLPASN